MENHFGTQIVTNPRLASRSETAQSSFTQNPHYDASYYAWQSADGEFIASHECWKFAPYVRPCDVVLDFGCGGGYILAGLDCRERYGVEVNPIARLEAERRFNVSTNVDDLPAEIRFDVIISHHALEHVDNPLRELQQLKSRLKPGGKIVLVVPAEIWPKQKVYRAQDINKHLYAWTPLSLGNLFTRAGLVVESTELLVHRLLPRTSRRFAWIPGRLFYHSCRAWAWVTRTRQIRIVASSPREH